MRHTKFGSAGAARALVAFAAVCIPGGPTAGLAAIENAQSRPVNYTRGATLSLVAQFADRQVTGIAVAPDGRIFVNLPRWTVDVPVSVAQLVHGSLQPYPDAEWNAWRNSKPLAPQNHFVCVQSVVVDPSGRLLWVLDPGSPAMSGPVKGAPKLVAIDLASNRIVRTIAFDARSAPPGSYLNDVRFTPDSKFAFMSDSGVRGAIVVADLSTGRSRRVLDGDPSTQFDPAVTVTIDGKPLVRPDGRSLQSGADGIAVSPDGRTFYWQALDGDTLYSIPSAVLESETAARSAAASIRTVAKTQPADGLWIDANDDLFVTDPTRNQVEIGSIGGPFSTLVTDPRLRWPDSFAQAGDGTIFFTTSHIQDSPWFHPEVTATPSEIWKIEPL
jgi:sugar lactone lactonase YvrE